jgi:Fungal Zn(2)-Cys(6) binuclear cluster domain
VGGLDGLDGVPNDMVLRSNALNPFELPVNSAVQPATHYPCEPEFKAVKRLRRPPRAVSACNSCRVRKTKCDEGKPQCFNCQENGYICTYRDLLPKSNRDFSEILDGVDRLKTMIVDLRENHRSCPPYKNHCEEDDRGSCFRRLEPSYHHHRYSDRDGGREDFIEVLSPELLPWLAKCVDLDHGQTSSQPPASFPAWQLKRYLYWYIMDPTTTITDVPFSMMLEIDGILRAQARDNLSRLRALYAQDIVRRTLFALLALHLQKSIGKLGILAGFSVESDGFVVLRTLSVVSKRIDLLHLVQDDSFHFDLHFANGYPSSWFPGAREPVPTPHDLDVTPESGEIDECGIGKVGDIQTVEPVGPEDGLRKIIEEVGGLGFDPFSFISRENLWKYSLCLHHLSINDHSHICNSQHLSKALTSINHCLRESLKKTLRERSDILALPDTTLATVQPVLDFLTLNIGTEVTRDIGERMKTRGHLRHITHTSEDAVVLHIQLLDKSWRKLEGPIRQVPFLWRSNRFAMKIVERGIDLPPHWFSNLELTDLPPH